MDVARARENFDRLKEEHAKAIKVTKERVRKWEQFKSDYESLQARLSTLPDKVTHEIMVPFGKFAFMPGQLYHTNEILVLLGDNWFVERSAKQAVAIAEQRKQRVIKLLEEEKKQLEDWEKRQEFTSHLEEPLKEHGGMVEIREKFIGEVIQGKKRKEHTSDPSKVKPHPPQRVSFDSSKAATKVQSDEALWKRLNELEEEEEMEREEVSTTKNTSDSTITGTPLAPVQNIKAASCAPTSSISPRSLAAVSSDSKQVQLMAPLPMRLVFSHTSSQEADQLSSRSHDNNDQSLTPEEADASDSQALFSSPADIFRSKSMPAAVREDKVESTQKSVSWNDNLVKSDNSLVKPDDPASTSRPHSTKPHTAAAVKAFSGEVMERVTPTVQQPIMDSTRKVSRFKASRQK